MNFRDKPELQERLAAEYALGTLRGAARRRLQRWMRGDAALALVVARWEARLAPLAEAVAPVAPPARLWREITAQLDAPGERLRAAPAGLWDSVAFWRSFGLAAGGAAAVLLAATVLLAPQPPQSAPAPVVLRAPPGEIPASYLAVLSDPKSGQAVLLVSAGRQSNELWIKTLDPSIQVSGKSLQLWGLPKDGAPRSLGLVEAVEKAALKLPAGADQALADIPTLAVSLEPRGGSPSGAPTGPVLFSGPCLKYW